MTRVYPSGGLLATKSVPRLLDAPGLFSTTTGWPSEPAIFSASERAITSIAPPVVAGTTILTTRDGYACAAASCAPSAAQSAAQSAASIHQFRIAMTASSRSCSAAIFRHHVVLYRDWNRSDTTH